MQGGSQQFSQAHFPRETSGRIFPIERRSKLANVREGLRPGFPAVQTKAQVAWVPSLMAVILLIIISFKERIYTAMRIKTHLDNALYLSTLQSDLSVPFIILYFFQNSHLHVVMLNRSIIRILSLNIGSLDILIGSRIEKTWKWFSFRAGSYIACHGMSNFVRFEAMLE